MAIGAVRRIVHVQSQTDYSMYARVDDVVGADWGPYQAERAPGGIQGARAIPHKADDPKVWLDRAAYAGAREQSHESLTRPRRTAVGFDRPTAIYT